MITCVCVIVYVCSWIRLAAQPWGTPDFPHRNSHATAPCLSSCRALAQQLAAQAQRITALSKMRTSWVWQLGLGTAGNQWVMIGWWWLMVDSWWWIQQVVGVGDASGVASQTPLWCLVLMFFSVFMVNDPPNWCLVMADDQIGVLGWRLWFSTIRNSWWPPVCWKTSKQLVPCD